GRWAPVTQRLGKRRGLMLIGSLAVHPLGAGGVEGGVSPPGGGFGPGFEFAGRESHRQKPERARTAGGRSHMHAHPRERPPARAGPLEDKTIKQELVARRSKLGRPAIGG